MMLFLSISRKTRELPQCVLLEKARKAEKKRRISSGGDRNEKVYFRCSDALDGGGGEQWPDWLLRVRRNDNCFDDMNDGTVSCGPGGLPWALNLCQIGVPSSGNGWTSESCKAAYAKLLAAQLSGQSVTIWFNADGFTCATQPTWTLNNKAYGAN